MVVDIMDLKFKNINLPREYDEKRYQRGVEIYNSGDAHVIHVDKKENEEYNITSVVIGNTSKYTIKINLDGEDVTDMNCTCLDFENGYVCKPFLI